MLMKKNVSLFVFFIMVFFLLTASNAFADGDGKEIPLPHSVNLYPDAVPSSEDTEAHGHDLSKNRIDEVKAFFDSGRGPNDRLEPFSEGDQKGSVLVMDKLGKKFELVTITTRTKSDHYVGEAFGQMKALSLRGMHSDAEFREIENSHSDLKGAYFRKIKTPDGNLKSEAEVIYKKYLDMAQGGLDKSSSGSDDSSQQNEGKARAAEMRKQMQEMKAKGDISGIMNMAQKNRSSSGVPKEAQKYMDVMNKDTWSVWVKCLDEMKNAAYYTSINYKSGIIGQ